MCESIGQRNSVKKDPKQFQQKRKCQLKPGMTKGRQDADRPATMKAVMALYRNGEDILIPDDMPLINTMKMKPPAGMTMRTAVDADFFRGVKFRDVI